MECGALTVNIRIHKTKRCFGKRSNVLKVAVRDIARDISKQDQLISESKRQSKGSVIV